jgi:hypothetical protein
MNARTPLRFNSWLSQQRSQIYFCLACLLLMINISCAPLNQQMQGQATLSAFEPPPTSTSPPSPTATGEALIPQGWMTYTNQNCEYVISHPADMQTSDEGTYSRTIGFELTNPDDAPRNFVYVSVINQEVQEMEGEVIYNYDPAEADILLNLQVGEIKTSRDIPQVSQWFSYQRLPDTEIDGYAAKTYENIQPWEFPEGTKEIRYYLSVDGCTYQIGGYLDTTQSNQPGAITETLFNQIVATIRVMP